MKADVVVIGAGPGGLMAAKTAAERGMKVVLVESRKDISVITRTCCQIFYLTHIGSGQSYSGPVRAEIGQDSNMKFIFPDLDLAVSYKGLLRSCYDWRYLSPEGTCVYTAFNKLWGLVFDKGLLLQQLLDEVRNLNVEVRLETTALDIRNDGGKTITTVRGRDGSTEDLEAKYAIVANGVNSRLVEKLGLNQERKQLSPPIKVFAYIMEGVECPYPPSTWVTFQYPSITPFINVWMGPMCEGTWQLAATAKHPDSAPNIMKNFLDSSHYAAWYKNARIISKSSCTLTPRMPINEPVVDNIMVIGDAAAPAETWVQGALACAWQAVRAMEKNAMQEYIAWWKGAFHFNTPKYYEELARYPALNMFMTDEELNYLYRLMKGKVVDWIFYEAMRHAEQIKAERPEVYEKLLKIEKMKG